MVYKTLLKKFCSDSDNDVIIYLTSLGDLKLSTFKDPIRLQAPCVAIEYTGEWVKESWDNTILCLLSNAVVIFLNLKTLEEVVVLRSAKEMAYSLPASYLLTLDGNVCSCLDLQTRDSGVNSIFSDKMGSSLYLVKKGGVFLKGEYLTDGKYVITYGNQYSLQENDDVCVNGKIVGKGICLFEGGYWISSWLELMKYNDSEVVRLSSPMIVEFSSHFDGNYHIVKLHNGEIWNVMLSETEIILVREIK